MAGELLKKGFYSDSASKSYYAMFYAAQALLVFSDINVIKHSAVESSFGYHFVKTGKIDSKFHRMLIDARKTREIADYAIDDKVIKSVARAKLEDAENFLDAIKGFLHRKDDRL